MSSDSDTDSNDSDVDEVDDESSSSNSDEESSRYNRVRGSAAAAMSLVSVIDHSSVFAAASAHGGYENRAFSPDFDISSNNSL